MWWVYVIQSLIIRPGNKPGFYYVGCTTDPARRLLEHNGIKRGGGKYTEKHRPWGPRALWGPYPDRSSAQKAEYTLKHSKKGINRTKWTSQDSAWCVGLGPSHPWVSDSSWKA
jgi:predicted GIY-YIG superfamily endonuclease